MHDKNVSRFLRLGTSNLLFLFFHAALSGLETTLPSFVLNTVVLQEDASELHLIQQINEVKTAMATGSTIVLLNHDQIYEALYDVLNQRFLYKTDQATGKIRCHQ